ncbi:MAG: 3-hydroxypropionyl-CoA synthetase [Methanoculleus sp. SDB]|nr:MAG: 3-hydroxypropionyl-CoA synthetase [Methanoculleus sp. SDB]
MAEDFEVSLNKTAVYHPDSSFRNRETCKDYATAYGEFLRDPDGFWRNIASDLAWFRPWDAICEWKYPFARWFVNAQLNITYNCLDRHVKNHRRNKVALFWRGEGEQERILTYDHLYKDVMQFANGLKKLGVSKGDRICIYMPMIPEQVIAMLACARIGAVHSVVFAGYGASALNQRITGAEARVVITAESSVRRGKTIPLKPIVEEALLHAPTVEHVIVLRTQQPPVTLVPDFEVDFYELMNEAPRECPPEVMDAEDPLFMLYTSGTTGTPKGIVHTCGGYMVGAYYTTRYVLNVMDNDVYWCTADAGWITGHTYGVYGPLLTGATLFISESTPDFPDPGIWWRLIEEYGINILYTAPTAIRTFMKFGEEWPDRYDLSSLRILASVGEPLNPEAFLWFFHTIGKKRCPIIDTWWQTETGMHMITTLAGEPMKPGYAGKPIPGVVADVVDRDGNSVPPGQGGFLAIKEPWPSMMRTIFKDEDRYRKYWESGNHPYYSTSDLAVKDNDGYIMILGRSDDLIIVSGHNIGSAEVESALVSHQAVAEAAAIGKPDPLKGNIVKAFVTLVEGYSPSDKLTGDLKYHVRQTLGPISVPAELEYTDTLPKTRSGKIMRRVLRARELGMDPGDISTLEE